MTRDKISRNIMSMWTKYYVMFGPGGQNIMGDKILCDTGAARSRGSEPEPEPEPEP